MASFRVINERDAPKPAKGGGRLNQRMAEYERYVAQVGTGRVGEMTPEEDESARGVSLRISRAGKRSGKDVRTWVANGNVYFKVS